MDQIGRWRARVRFGIASLTIMLAACTGVPDATRNAIDSVESGTARQALQAWFDRHRQCALVLNTDRAGRLTASRGDARAAALVSAGLIEAVAPASPADGDLDLFRVRADARRWFESVDLGGHGRQVLCYARRGVTSVTVDPAGPSLRYTYTLRDPAPWLSAPFARSFPAIAAVMNAGLAGPEKLAMRDGAPVLDRMQPTYADATLFALGANFGADPP